MGQIHERLSWHVPCRSWRARQDVVRLIEMRCAPKAQQPTQSRLTKTAKERSYEKRLPLPGVSAASWAAIREGRAKLLFHKRAGRHTSPRIEHQNFITTQADSRDANL